MFYSARRFASGERRHCNCLLVFIPLMGEYLNPVILGGDKTVYAGNLIGQQFLTSRDWPFGSAIAMVLIVVLAKALAMILIADFRFKWVVRFLVLLPWTTPIALAAVAWLWMLDSVYSPIDWVLRSLGFIESNVYWLGKDTLAMASVIAAALGFSVRSGELGPLGWTAVLGFLIVGGSAMAVLYPRRFQQDLRASRIDTWFEDPANDGVEGVTEDAAGASVEVLDIGAWAAALSL
jgi:ABC-type Fe3+ transport system permease subunit